MLTFWETVRGVRLADTLTRELPKIRKEFEKKQETFTFKKAEVKEELPKLLEDGFAFVDKIDLGEEFILIMKK